MIESAWYQICFCCLGNSEWSLGVGKTAQTDLGPGYGKPADLRACLSEGLSVLEWRRGKRPERRFTGLFRGDLADSTGGWRETPG